MLKANMCFSPFMGDNKPLSVGLNPLGIRTASEQLFTTLLPGLNVVTLRVRYYSFYCWLLKSFYETRAEAKKYDFQRYIRINDVYIFNEWLRDENDYIMKRQRNSVPAIIPEAMVYYSEAKRLWGVNHLKEYGRLL